MIRGRRRLVPTFDRLESLVAPGGGMVSAQVIAPRPRPRPLTDIHGEQVATQAVPDMGRTVRLAGSAWIDNLGSVPFTGNVTGNGFVAKGRAGGSIVFAGKGGAMTVELVGPVQPGFSAPPARFHYRVTRAGADFAGFKGSGTATLTLGDDGRFAMRFRPGLAKV